MSWLRFTWVRRHWPKILVLAVALYVIGPTATVDPGAPGTEGHHVNVPASPNAFPFVCFPPGPSASPPIYDVDPCPTPVDQTDQFIPGTFARPASFAIYTTHPALRLIKWTGGGPIEGFAICNAPGQGCK